MRTEKEWLVFSRSQDRTIMLVGQIGWVLSVFSPIRMRCEKTSNGVRKKREVINWSLIKRWNERVSPRRSLPANFSSIHLLVSNYRKTNRTVPLRRRTKIDVDFLRNRSSTDGWTERRWNGSPFNQIDGLERCPSITKYYGLHVADEDETDSFSDWNTSCCFPFN